MREIRHRAAESARPGRAKPPAIPRQAYASPICRTPSSAPSGQSGDQTGNDQPAGHRREQRPGERSGPRPDRSSTSRRSGGAFGAPVGGGAGAGHTRTSGARASNFLPPSPETSRSWSTEVKPPCCGAPVNDPLGEHRTDAGQRIQIGGGGGIQIQRPRLCRGAARLRPPDRPAAARPRQLLTVNQLACQRHSRPSTSPAALPRRPRSHRPPENRRRASPGPGDSPCPPRPPRSRQAGGPTAAGDAAGELGDGDSRHRDGRLRGGAATTKTTPRTGRQRPRSKATTASARAPRTPGSSRAPRRAGGSRSLTKSRNGPQRVNQIRHRRQQPHASTPPGVQPPVGGTSVDMPES